MTSVYKLFITVTLLISSVFGHTWLDCVNVTNPRTVTSLANLQCNAYPRSYVGRSRPDDNMWKIEGMSNTAFLNYPACRDATRVYSTQYPMMKLKAGEKMTVAYTPNGHTRWHSPPPPNGPRNFWVKWTGKAGQNLMTMQEVLNAPSLYQVVFDEPCHSRVTGAELDSSSGICMADITIPANTPSGTYQLVWYWPFRYAGDNVIEDYTTCWDVEVTGTSAQPATTGVANVGTTGQIVESTSTTGVSTTGVSMSTESTGTTGVSVTTGAVVVTTGYVENNETSSGNGLVSGQGQENNAQTEENKEAGVSTQYVIIGASVGGAVLLAAIVVIAILVIKMRANRFKGQGI